MTLQGLIKDDWLLDEFSLAKNELDREQGVGVFEGAKEVVWDYSTPLLPGFFLKNRLNVLVAEQGAGKSNFCLALFRSLVERTASFLNLSIPIDGNYELFLVGPDMAVDGWGPALVANALCASTTAIQENHTPNQQQRATRIPQFRYFSDSSSTDSLSPRDIERYRDMALDSVKRGQHPIFVFDSYSSLVSAYKDIDEIKSAFANPLQNLQRRMTGISATLIVLHHTTKSSTNTEKAGSGTNRFGRIPDVIVKMERFNNSPLSSDKRLVIQSAKRIDATNLLIEQTDFETGVWVSHGDATAYIHDNTLIETIARLSGPKQRVFDNLQDLWANYRKGLSRDEVAGLLEVSPQAAGNHLKWLEKNHLVFIGDKAPGLGRSISVFYPYNAKEELNKAFHKGASETFRNPSETPVISTDFPVHQGVSSNLTDLTKHTKGENGLAAAKAPDINVDGAAVPRKSLLVEVLQNGNWVNNHVISCDGMNRHDITVEKLGDPTMKRKGLRWGIDVRACCNDEDEL